MLLLWILLPACFVVREALAATLPASAICIVAENGLVLAEQEADLTRPPASMVKMMLLLLVTEGLEAHRWTLDKPLLASKQAELMGGTQVFLKAGQSWPLGKLMEAVAIASANDAALAVAEGLWESSEAYLRAANQRAKQLGMTNTVFRSVHGLPPDKGGHFDQTTARDMARLAQECVKHQRILEWTRGKEMRFRPNSAVYYNTNKMLWRMEDCDGLKTGFIRAAGFCVTATVERDGIRLISVVMGSTKYGRFNLAKRMMESGFQELRRVRAVQAKHAVGEIVPVANCATPELRLAAGSDVWVTVREEDIGSLEITTRRPETLQPPIRAGSVVGELCVELEDKVLGKAPLIAPIDLDSRGWRLKVHNGAAHWEGLDDGPPATE